MPWANNDMRVIMRAGVKERFIGKITDSRKTAENLKKKDTCDYGLKNPFLKEHEISKFTE